MTEASEGRRMSSGPDTPGVVTSANTPWSRADGNSSSTQSSSTTTANHNSTGRAPVIANANSRSVSMASVSSEGSNGSQVVESLTSDVKHFKEALGRLRRVFNPDVEVHETKRVACQEYLGEVLRILRLMLEKYPQLQSNDLMQSAGYLITQVKEYNAQEDDTMDEQEFHRALDSLAYAFSNRVSDYLNGDIDSTSSSSSNRDKGSSQHPHHHYHLPQHGGSERDENAFMTAASELKEETLSPDQIDAILLRHDQGVDHALQCAKKWEKYAKDVMSYVEKRTKLDLERARGLTALAQNIRPILKEESYLPFQSIYCTAVDQDLEMCASTLDICSRLQGNRFVEPLAGRRSEHKKTRNMLKDRWTRELKLMHDTTSNLQKAQSLFVERKKEYERCRDAVRIAEQGAEIGATGENKVDKRKKLADDALQKVVESESYCKQCVLEANDRHRQLVIVKKEILAQIRELILKCDQTMKTATVSYFQLQHTLTSPVPVQFQTLCERSRLYEPGSQFMEYVQSSLRDLPTSPRLTATGMEQPFNFDSDEHMLFFERQNQNHPRKMSASIDLGDDFGSGTYKLRGEKGLSSGSGPLMAWTPSMGPIEPSDTDSLESRESGKSRDTSPSSSPMVPSRRPPPGMLASSEEIENEHDVPTTVTDAPMPSTHSMITGGRAGGGGGRGSLGAVPRRSLPLSVAAKTHRFRKLRTPSRCRECDSYIAIFKGVDCQECGLCAHKKCLEHLPLLCGHKRLPRKLPTFGVDLGHHLLEVGAQIPPIVIKCVNEIDKRAIRVEGIYRKSGVKHKIDKLGQAFESAPELVELGDIQPNVIANVLKNYMRELPEPLLTFGLYGDFIHVAKCFAADDNSNSSLEREEVAVQELTELVRKLPRNHYRTLGFLIHHLNRVAKECEVNNMPASNLGIVFGPTLMRSADSATSLSPHMDNDHQNSIIKQQSRTIELLTLHACAIFGPPESVLPKDFAKYTRGVGDVVKRASITVPPITTSTSSDMIISSQTERRSLDTREEFTLPGHVNEREPNDDYITDDDDDAEAIPACWLPDESAKTKKSPLLIRGTSSPPKIIKASLKSFSGLEGVTPERLSTQDSMETTQRLSKQVSEAGGGTVGGRKSISHDHKHLSLFAKMGKAAQKHSLDEDYLVPLPPQSTSQSHPALSERLSSGGDARGGNHLLSESEPLSAPADVLDGPSLSSVISSSTSPGSGRSSLTIHNIGNRSSSLSEEHHGISSAISVAEQRRKFLAGSISSDSGGTQTATSSVPATITSMSSSLPTSMITNLDENRVKIQVPGGISTSFSTGPLTGGGGSRHGHRQHPAITRQASTDKGSHA
eukprot:snap_masked-scaffold966_size75752-processed-gene-0.12 protein:Tk02199 transcript:snap_masked-scaffold966_size75752-processed-gene-0.12-mRNA-1 annotation:"minor histocompatibility protein ha-1"